MILSELADVDSRLSLERGDGNQHPPLNSCHGIGHSVVIPALVRTHLRMSVRSSLRLHLSSCPTKVTPPVPLNDDGGRGVRRSDRERRAVGMTIIRRQ